MRRFAPLLLLALIPFFMGMSKKPKFTISIHAQADEMDVPKTMFPVNIGNRRMMFKLLPEITQENVVAFHPFPSDTGDGMGVALQLEVRGRGALEIATRTRQGEYLIAMVNGKLVDISRISRPVSDGIITIWQGVPPETVAEMDKKIRRIKADGTAPSMSTDMEMIPSTRKERKKAKKDADEADKAAEKARKAGKPVEPEIPSLPAAPVSSQIPVEGGTPPTAPGSSPSAPSQPAPAAPAPPLPAR